MKKILSLICVCFLAITLMAPLAMSTSALVPDFEIQIGQGETDPGKIVKVPVMCTKNNVGIWGFQFELSFDKTELVIPNADTAERDKDNRIVESVYVDYTDSAFQGKDFSIIANAEETSDRWTIIVNAMSNSLSVNSKTTGKIMEIWVELSESATRYIPETENLNYYRINGSFLENNMIDKDGQEIGSMIHDGYVTSTGYNFEISGPNGYIKKDGVVDTEYNGMFEDPKSERIVYIVQGAWVKVTGVYNVGGKLYQLLNGSVDTTKTGLYKHTDGKWYYFENGIQSSKTLLVKHTDGKWYHIKNGVKTNSTLLFKHTDGKYYHIKNGVKTSETTLFKHTDGKWYYVQKGVCTKTNTLVKYNNKWYFVKNGIYSSANKDTTLVKYNNKWYYIKSGVFASTATTLCKYNNKWYYVYKGSTSTATTLVKYNNKWYFVKKGFYNSANKDTTLVKYTDGKWYYVKNGVKNNSTCIMTYNKVKKYVKAGVWQSGFSGKVKIGTKTYTIKKGNVV